MTEDTKQITADNLRAEFLNATTNWQRWKVLNKALDWAVAASENAEHLRQRGYTRCGERVLSNGVHTLRGGDDILKGDERWLVRKFVDDGRVEIVPLASDWATRAQVVDAASLFAPAQTADTGDLGRSAL